MIPDEVRIAQHIRENPPSCVTGFRLRSGRLPERLDDFHTAYNLSCPCGHGQGSVRGYPLIDYNQYYVGPDFITPLSFRCEACGAVTQIIDTDAHGYHAEVARLEGGSGSAKLRGDGEPVPFACPGCSAVLFTVTVCFVYWDFDIMLDEPGLPGEEFFNLFLIYVSCQNCGTVSSVVDLGKL